MTIARIFWSFSDIFWNCSGFQNLISNFRSQALGSTSSKIIHAFNCITFFFFLFSLSLSLSRSFFLSFSVSLSFFFSFSYFSFFLSFFPLFSFLLLIQNDCSSCLNFQANAPFPRNLFPRKEGKFFLNEITQKLKIVKRVPVSDKPEWDVVLI